MGADLTAEEMIERLGLEAHPEGGWYVETWRDQPADGGRGAGSAIYFLLRHEEQSHWHRVDAAEIWLHHAGAPLKLLIADHTAGFESVDAPGGGGGGGDGDGGGEGVGVGVGVVEHRLGSDLSVGQRPQVIVPPGAWQSARTEGDWTLVSCTVSPAFEFERFELAPPGWEPGDSVPAEVPQGAEADQVVGEEIQLRPILDGDVARLVEMRSHEAVERWWPLDGRTALEAVTEGIEDPDAEARVVVLDGKVVGFVRWFEESDPSYRHASVDLYLDPAVHGRGLGRDTVRAVCRHLFDTRGHHRITIDPAADNEIAIACYRSVGFRPIGTLRRYERTSDGQWRDGLFMDLLTDELT